MLPEDFGAWFGLSCTPGLSRSAARALLKAWGSPQAVLGATQAQWAAVAGAQAAQALAQPEEPTQQRLAAARAWLNGGQNRHAITLGDDAYPGALLHCADPPLLLFVHGHLQLLQQPSVAVVGSRQATPQGLANARHFAAQLSNSGVPVVSGLAVGIDGAAHEGALQGPGSTVAVVGTGLDIVYPRRHGRLADRIAALGALISEYPPGTPVQAHHFPHRNRIIAGITRGTLVVEASLKSGSLITARLAADGGREVFAVPGSIHSPQSSGCHELIRQGAQLVECAQDVLDGLGLRPSPAPCGSEPQPEQAPHTHPENRLLQAMGYDPVGMDALAGRTGWPVSELGARLLDLELQGCVVRLPGGLFQQHQQG